MREFALSAYRCAWQLLLPPVALLARIDLRLRASTGRGFLPRGWQVCERAGMIGETEDRDESRMEPCQAASTAVGAIWLHCASLGEAKGLWVFAESLAGEEGVEGMVLTATTREGAAYLARQCEAFRSGHPASDRRLKSGIAPFDHPRVVRGFLECHRVRGLCLYEAELWPHFLSACLGMNLPVTLVSGMMTRRTMRIYRRSGAEGARLLDSLAWIQAQSPADLERFRSLTRTEVFLGFDFKAAHYWDRSARTHRETRVRTDPLEDPRFAPFFPPGAPAMPRFAFVSLHYPELLLLLDGLPALMRRFDILVFPRRMAEVKKFRRVLEPLGFGSHSRDPHARHLLVDSMGRVGTLLAGCRSAFVGGSLVPPGCHNLWEPLFAGTRIHFGPHLQTQETLAGMLLRRGIAEALGNPARIGECLPPGPEVPAACALLAEELREGLETALADGLRRIFVTFYPNAHARTPRTPTPGPPAKTRELR